MREQENRSVKDLLLEIEALREQNDFLQQTCEQQARDLVRQRNVNRVLKVSCNKVTEERNRLSERLSHVTLWDLSEEEQIKAGRQFAQELLHPPVYKSDEEIIEDTIAAGEAHYERTWNINCEEDF